MRKHLLTGLIALCAVSLSSCKKKTVNFAIPVTIEVTQMPSNTRLSMQIDNQNGERIFTTTDQKQPDPSVVYSTKDVYSGDVIKVHYSSNLPVTTTTNQGTATLTFKRDGKVLTSVSGDLGYTTGKTITINIK